MVMKDRRRSGLSLTIPSSVCLHSRSSTNFITFTFNILLVILSISLSPSPHLIHWGRMKNACPSLLGYRNTRIHTFHQGLGLRSDRPTDSHPLTISRMSKLRQGMGEGERKRRLITILLINSSVYDVLRSSLKFFSSSSSFF